MGTMPSFLKTTKELCSMPSGIDQNTTNRTSDENKGFGKTNTKSFMTTPDRNFM